MSLKFMKEMRVPINFPLQFQAGLLNSPAHIALKWLYLPVTSECPWNKI